MTLAPRGRGRARSAAFATVCAATDPNVNVWLLITAAAVGSIIGDNVGYLARKEVRLRTSPAIWPSHWHVGRWYQNWAISFPKAWRQGRFLRPVRRVAADIGGGSRRRNRMPWRGFLLANAGGAVIWAAVFGVGGYLFGKVLLELHGAFGPIAFVLATAVLLGCRLNFGPNPTV